jgi:hypothetical protein
MSTTESRERSKGGQSLQEYVLSKEGAETISPLGREIVS